MICRAWWINLPLRIKGRWMEAPIYFWAITGLARRLPRGKKKPTLEEWLAVSTGGLDKAVMPSCGGHIDFAFVFRKERNWRWLWFYVQYFLFVYAKLTGLCFIYRYHFNYDNFSLSLKLFFFQLSQGKIYFCIFFSHFLNTSRKCN